MNNFCFFKELEHGISEGMSIYDFLSKKPFKNKQKVVNYLKNGHIIVSTPGLSADVLSNDNTVSGVPSILSDGSWVWTGDLAYYVENYNLMPPVKMLQIMEKNNWQVPSLSKKDLVAICEYLDHME